MFRALTILNSYLISLQWLICYNRDQLTLLMLMTRLDQLKLATRGLVLDEASHDPLKYNRIKEESRL